MLKDIGIDWAIIGHSERREYNAETSLACNAKIKALLSAGMTPVYCLGESLATFEKGETKSFVAHQLEEGLRDLTPDEAKKVVIAYEPIWAIGTGKSATKDIAEDVIGFIRRSLRERFGAVAEDIRPKLRSLSGRADGKSAALTMTLDAGSTANLSPELVISSFLASAGLDIPRYKIDVVREQINFVNNLQF